MSYSRKKRKARRRTTEKTSFTLPTKEQRKVTPNKRSRQSEVNAERLRLVKRALRRSLIANLPKSSLMRDGISKREEPDRKKEKALKGNLADQIATVGVGANKGIKQRSQRGMVFNGSSRSKNTCKERPEGNKTGAGGSRPFVPWCGAKTGKRKT